MLGESKGQENKILDKNGALAPYETETFYIGSYDKTNKLITALYMITDIMDREEPLRNKLRNLGTNVISDIHLLKGQPNYYTQLTLRISEILSFLEIARGVGIVSEMNSNIIKKEFNELRKSIDEYISGNDQKWLEEFMKEDEKKEEKNHTTRVTLVRNYGGDNGHKNAGISQNGTRIGVQKAGTLMKALSDRIPTLTNGEIVHKNKIPNTNHNEDSRNKRREEIISIIKDKASTSLNFDGVTITDIKSIGHGVLATCGEKTLQRELVSMVMDGVLKKTGEKRWSKYSLN